WGRATWYWTRHESISSWSCLCRVPARGDRIARAMKPHAVQLPGLHRRLPAGDPRAVLCTGGQPDGAAGADHARLAGVLRLVGRAVRAAAGRADRRQLADRAMVRLLSCPMDSVVRRRAEPRG